MNKTELVAAIAEKTGLPIADAAKAVTAFTDVVTDTLVKGENVQLIGFGNFEVHPKPERIARNINTGEAITVAAHNAPAFKAGTALKKAVK